MGSHALLSASASHIWLHCTPAPRLTEGMPDVKTPYSEEGSLAHAIGELKLQKQFHPMSQAKYKSALKKLQETTFAVGDKAGQLIYQPEMDKHTDAYRDYAASVVHSFSSPPYVAIEKRLNYEVYAPGGFGTGDLIVIGGDLLVVTDFKYGKGVPVSAVDNSQVKLYALAALLELGFLYPVSRVKLVIVQPRLDSISEWELSVNELLAWGEGIKSIAKAAWEGTGEFVSGEWCRFCKAKAACRARSNAHTALEDFGFKLPPLLTDEEVGKVLVMGKTLKDWVEKLEEYALSQCLAGQDVPGWKAVEGRGSRDYIDQDAAFVTLIQSGISSDMLYERKPLSVPALEKLLGSAEYKRFEESGQVIKRPGKPTLVTTDDKRQAISNRTSAAEDFANVIAGQAVNA